MARGHPWAETGRPYPCNGRGTKASQPKAVQPPAQVVTNATGRPVRAERNASMLSTSACCPSLMVG